MVGCVLWHINHCRSLNHKYCLYIYIYIYVCNEKRGWNSFMPTMLLAPTFRVTLLSNSYQLLLTQCLLSALRITRLCNSHQLPLNSMSALRSQNNTPCLANLVFL